MQIRNACIDDFPAVQVLEEQVFALHRAARPDYFQDTQNSYTRREFENLLASPNPIALVAEQDGAVIGLCFGRMETTPEGAICRSRKLAFIEDMIVAPEHRGGGIASALMAEAKRLAVAWGAAALELHVWNFNEDALRLYRKLGFSTQYIRMEQKL